MPDEDLARHPVIVVARWSGAPLTAHRKVEWHASIKGNVIKEIEGRTEISIERVVTGDIGTGKHRILLAPFLGWDSKGGAVRSYMSTEMIGERLDVRQPNLWFLSPGRSWDKANPTTYLILDTYRGVQPLELEEYFQALRSNAPQKLIPKLLQSRRPTVVLRALEYMCGGVLPWPYEPDFHPVLNLYGPKRTRKPLVEHAAAVEKLLSGKDSMIRQRAAAVYAELAGKQSLPRMRSMLADRDSVVRAIAIGTLARYRDGKSTEAICRAARGIDDPLIGCRVIDVLRRWNHDRIVPALIVFLQNDQFAYRFGDDVGIPAVRAEAALHAITGFSFPFEVDESLKLWSKAATFANPSERKQYLSELLATASIPVKAKFTDDGGNASIIVTNTSARPVTLSKQPALIDFLSDRGLCHNTFEAATRDSFLTLSPGEATQFKVSPQSIFLTSSRESKKVTLFYESMGTKYGLRAWVGIVEATTQTEKPAKE